jgi:hypothetical protein
MARLAESRLWHKQKMDIYGLDLRSAFTASMD